MNLNISINLAFLMCLVFCISTQSIAQTLANPIQPSTVNWNALKFNKVFNDNRWGVLEGGSQCTFLAMYENTQSKLRLEAALKLPECESTINTTYELLSDNVLLVDWQQERGGTAFLFSPTPQKMFWLELPYMSGDEESLVAKIQGTQVVISTSKNKFVLDILPNEGLKIVKSMSRIEDERSCTSTQKFKEGGSKGASAAITLVDGKIEALNVESYITNGLEGGAYFCRFDTTDLSVVPTWSTRGSSTTLRVETEYEESVVTIKKAGDSYVIYPGPINRYFCGSGAEWPASITIKTDNETCEVVDY